MATILEDIKAQLGVPTDDTSFDQELLIHINAALDRLRQLGVGTNIVAVKLTTWEQFSPVPNLPASSKSYVFLKVKLLFDPPETGFTTAAYERQLDALEITLNYEVDYGLYSQS